MPTNSNQIFGGWAEAYNLIQGSDTDAVGRSSDDVSFYRQQTNEVDGKILEIGCGTGRIYLELLEDGQEVYGIDSSQDQLDLLKSSAETRGVEPQIYRADMRCFNLNEQFDLIIIPFNTFAHNTSRKDQFRCLERVKEHLSQDGKAVLDFPLPRYDSSRREYIETDKFTIDGNGFFLVQEYKIDPIKQILEIERYLFKNGEEVGTVSYKYAHIFKNEFIHLIQRVGFEDWNVYGDFHRGTLEPDSSSLIWEIFPSTAHRQSSDHTNTEQLQESSRE